MKTYLRHKIWNVVEIKELIALEYLDFEGKYKDYRESHDFWELCYVEEGDAAVFLSDSQMLLKRGQLLLIAPGTEHYYRSDRGNRTKVFVVCFGSYSQELKTLAERVFLPDTDKQRVLREVISESRKTFFMNEKELLETVEHPNFGGQQMIIILLEYLVIGLLRQLSEKESAGIVFLSSENFHADLVKVILEYFREHLGEKLSLEDICTKVNYSRSFLCKTFKEQTGETLAACFQKMKILEAERLLLNTDLSASEIAGSLGFPETKYFSEVFKKQTGMTPTACRSGCRK